MSDHAQPKIPVKKADGTTVFMTLDEFSEYRKGASSPAPVPTSVSAPAPDKKESENVSSVSYSAMDHPALNEDVDHHWQKGKADIDAMMKRADEIGDRNLAQSQEIVQDSEDVEEPEELQPVPSTHMELAIETPHELATTVLVPNIFVDEAMAAEASGEDHITNWKPKQRDQQQMQAVKQMQKQVSDQVDTSEESIPLAPSTSSVLGASVPVPKPASMSEPLKDSQAGIQTDSVSISAPMSVPKPTPSSKPAMNPPVDVPTEPMPQLAPMPMPAPHAEAPLVHEDLHQELKSDIPQHVDVAPAGLPDDQMEKCNRLIGELSFKVDPDLEGRFCSLLQTRLKGIRNDNQFLEYAMRTASDGGLALSSDQIREVLEKVAQVGQTSKMPTGTPMDVEKAPHSALDQVDMTKVMQDQRNQSSTMSSGRPSMPMMDVAPKPYKPQIKDVAAPQETASYGPLDVLKTFSLVDLRRLGSSPEQTVAALKEKMEVLKGDTYLLYMQGVDAYHHSPLFLQYEKIILDSLNKRKPLTDVIAEQAQEGFSAQEFDALANMHTQIAY
ncbi:hypothetical protein H6758_04265 [Candidatus Nomurabacteria bacterium]|nr:hypothetical protein [Candidatus Nomurabacteria bacterium]